MSFSGPFSLIGSGCEMSGDRQPIPGVDRRNIANVRSDNSVSTNCDVASAYMPSLTWPLCYECHRSSGAAGRRGELLLEIAQSFAPAAPFCLSGLTVIR